MAKDQYKYKALATRILTVACYSAKTWRVYIGIVPGMNHDDEYMEITRRGTALNEELARVLFPGIAALNLEYKEDD